MADGEQSALGLSIGATNLAAVTADRAVTRKPVLTWYRQRPAEVGVPAENPKLVEPGLVIADFVGKVGDPAGVTAADNTTHRSETLIADALRALASAVTDGRVPPKVGVTHPAHWDAAAVEAVRIALNRAPEWSRGTLSLVPDSAAAVFALRANPGIPDTGVLAVCDFGGSGTTVSLVDAADENHAVAPARRHVEFSGDRVDQALMNHVIDDLSTAGSFDTAATSAIGSLRQLRTTCRSAKERLSSANVTVLTADVPGYRGEIELTRADLESAIRQPLASFMGFFHDVLQRNGIGLEDLAAIVAVGGGAAIPLVARTLSEQSGALVISAPRPHLSAAVGAALRASKEPGDTATAMAPTASGWVGDATTVSELPPQSAVAPPLAWSEAEDDSGIVPLRTGEYDDVVPEVGLSSSPGRPQAESGVGGRNSAVDRWYRRPAAIAVGSALAVLAVGAAVLSVMGHQSDRGPRNPPPIVSTTSGSAEPSPAETTTHYETTTNPPPSATDTSTSVSTTVQPPSSSTSSSQIPTTTTTTTQPSTSTSTSPSTQRPLFPRRPGDRLIPEPGQGGR